MDLQSCDLSVRWTGHPFALHLEAFARELERQRRRPATVVAYVRDLNRYFEYLHRQGWHPLKVGLEALEAYRQHSEVGQELGPNSFRRRIIAIRRFYRCLEDGRYQFFDQSWIPPRCEKLDLKLSLPRCAVMIAAMESDAPTLRGLRDLALFCLMGLDGIKMSESLALRCGDWLGEDSGGLLRVGGGRARLVQLDPVSQRHLCFYLAWLGREVWPDLDVRQQARCHLFTARAHPAAPPMSRHGAKFIIYRIGERFSLPELNSENLRNHAIRRLITAGHANETIRLHLGLQHPGLIARHRAAMAALA